MSLVLLALTAAACSSEENAGGEKGKTVTTKSGLK
jgi:hypothetical protein